MLRYPYFQDKFIIQTGASDIQLGAIISQKGSPIAFFARVLNKEQSK